MFLMNLSRITAINVVLNIYNSLILLFIIINLKKERANNWLIHCCFLLISFAITDSISWLFDGNPSNIIFLILKIGTFIYYLVQPFIFMCFIYYVRVFVQPEKENKPLWKASFVILGVYLLLLCLTPFFGFFYSFSPDHFYSRGSIHYISVAIDGLYIISGLFYILENRKIITNLEFFCFFLFLLVPSITEIIQLFNYGISLIVTGLTAPIIIIFMNIHNDLENRLKIANDSVKEKDQQLIKLQNNTIIGLSNLVENRQQDTGNHVLRITKYVEAICNQCIKNNVYPNTIDNVYIMRLTKSVPMHDIGKIVVPDEILTKKEKLTDEDFINIKRHTTEGAKIVKDVLSYEVDSKLIKMAENVALYHHEKWDGSGYPKSLKNHNIPLSARIMSIADVFDALVTSRIYKEKTVDLDSAFAIINAGKGKQFDPDLVEQFMQIQSEIRKIVDDYGV